MVGKIYKNRKYNIPKETINSLKDFFLTSSLANRFAIILSYMSLSQRFSAGGGSASGDIW